MSRRSARQIRIAELVANRANIREGIGDVTELARSIKRHGILEPLLVTEDTMHRGWLILAGHRRLAGAQQAGLTSVPCFIHHDLADGNEQVVIMLVENVQRRNLAPMEKARAYGRLRSAGLGAADIARRTGIHVSSIASHLALLDTDAKTQTMVEHGEITAKDAIAAVREDRQRDRSRKGLTDRGRPTIVDPAWLTSAHRLAAAVKSRCHHSTRPKVGAVGCGQCWEHVIRLDESIPTDPAVTDGDDT